MRRVELSFRGVLVGIGLSPLVQWAAARMGADVPVLRSWFELQCHQLAARSFELFGTTLPVCARCLGIYLALGVAGAFSRGRTKWSTLALVMLAGGLAMAFDVWTESRGVRTANAALRFLTGALFAAPAAVAVVRFAREWAEAPQPNRSSSRA